jgi:hypothetical protein
LLSVVPCVFYLSLVGWLIIIAGGYDNPPALNYAPTIAELLTVVQRVSFVGISSNTRTEPDALGTISLIIPVFFDFRVVNKSPTL